MEHTNLSIINKQKTEFIVEEKSTTSVSEILTGLLSAKKYISSRFFYDENGSRLFEEITKLPEYYLSKTEKSILLEIAPQLVKTIKNTGIIELGSGDCSKISILLDAMPDGNLKLIQYTPVDVSKDAIQNSAEILTEKYSDLRVYGIQADFLKHLPIQKSNVKKLYLFFGSTVGNLTYYQTVKLLTDIKNVMNTGDEILIGMDMVKDVKVLEDAYNDNQGITAEFNKNILNAVNKIIKSDFDPEKFNHIAFFNEKESRIEMHLKAIQQMEISSPFLINKIKIEEGETIHTENSFKYSSKHITDFSFLTGLKIKDIYNDRNKWFSLVHYYKS